MKNLIELLKESVNIENDIESGAPVTNSKKFLSALSDLININMNEYDDKWSEFIDVLNDNCKSVKTPYMTDNEVIIAYANNFKVSEKLVGNKSNDGVGTLFILYGNNLPNSDENNITLKKFYKHELYTGESIYTFVLSTNVFTSTIRGGKKIIFPEVAINYNRFIKTLKKMNMYKITGDVASKLIEMGRYNRWDDKKSY